LGQNKCQCSLFQLVKTGVFSKQSDAPNALQDYKITLRQSCPPITKACCPFLFSPTPPRRRIITLSRVFLPSPSVGKNEEADVVNSCLRPAAPPLSFEGAESK
jgi:hypothetical protein